MNLLEAETLKVNFTMRLGLFSRARIETAG